MVAIYLNAHQIAIAELLSLALCPDTQGAPLCFTPGGEILYIMQSVTLGFFASVLLDSFRQSEEFLCDHLYLMLYEKEGN